jgi:hypothetical protein
MTAPPSSPPVRSDRSILEETLLLVRSLAEKQSAEQWVQMGSPVLATFKTQHEAIEWARRNGQNVFVEPRPKGRPEGSAIEDYVVEDHADHVLATFKTQHEAIEWARRNGQTPLVARVRHLNDKKKADHWRVA